MEILVDLDEVYVSYRVYLHDAGGQPHDGPQLKFARATSADTDVIHGDISIGMTYVGAFGEGSAIWFNDVVMPMFTRPEQIISVWVDEVYVDSTQARVEIGDAPHWYDCTDRSPQPILSWSDSEIRIRLNQGRLQGEAYGFVVTQAGEILELGFLGRWEQ